MSNIEERLSKVNANDRRVKRTKKLLRDSLFTLLQEKSINEIADELAGKIKVCKMNVDESEKIAIRYGIMRF